MNLLKDEVNDAIKDEYYEKTAGNVGLLAKLDQNGWVSFYDQSQLKMRKDHNF